MPTRTEGREEIIVLGKCCPQCSKGSCSATVDHSSRILDVLKWYYSPRFFRRSRQHDLDILRSRGDRKNACTSTVACVGRQPTHAPRSVCELGLCSVSRVVGTSRPLTLSSTFTALYVGPRALPPHLTSARLRQWHNVSAVPHHSPTSYHKYNSQFFGVS